MFSNPGKMGRGGGRRGLKRLIPPPTSHRPVRGPAHLPAGVAPPPRQRNSHPSQAAAPVMPEETFRLISEDTLAFGLIIRLAPDLVEELRRVETQGGAARIRFDNNPNNSSGNVIDVGGKDFRFTWSRELSDCDIYEEHKSEEGACGLLVESGSVWRKLNVQRVLDESAKNHVKKRTEEAQLLLKSRKAIVLDPANPSVKNQVKTLASVDANPRRMHMKQRKGFSFKRQKVIKYQDLSKTVTRSGISTVAKPQSSVSPHFSQPDQYAFLTSFMGTEGSSRGHETAGEVTPLMNEESLPTADEIMHPKDITAMAHEVLENTINARMTTKYLRRTMIKLLLENPKGMNLKSLEKAVGGAHPDNEKKIDMIIKQIATVQATGKCFLKPGVGEEYTKKSTSENESSLDFMQNQLPHGEAAFVDNASSEEMESEAHLSSRLLLNGNLENDNHADISPASGRKQNDCSEEKASSGSRTDSESDSDSTDSESDTGSQSKSKSRSPGGSASGTNSDTNSDSFSSCKEGSDVDVDIMMSDDEKGEIKQEDQVYEKEDGRTSVNGLNMMNGVKEERLVSEIVFSDPQSLCHNGDAIDDIDVDVDITDDSPMINRNQEIVVCKSTEPVHCETNAIFEESEISNHADCRHSANTEEPGNNIIYANGWISQIETVGQDYPASEESDSIEKLLNGKSKGAFSLRTSREKIDNLRRLKGEIFNQESLKEHTDNTNEHTCLDSKEVHIQTLAGRYEAFENVQQKRGDHFHNSSVPDRVQLKQRANDLNVMGMTTGFTEQSRKRSDNLGRGSLSSERAYVVPVEQNDSVIKSPHLVNDVSMLKGKTNQESHVGDGDTREKSTTQFVTEKLINEAQCDLNYKNIGEQSSKQASGQVDIGGMLRRELSDLELGEFRGPLQSHETHGMKQQFEMKKSLQSEKNETDEFVSTSDNMLQSRRLFEQKKSSKSLENITSFTDGVDLEFGNGKPMYKEDQELNTASSPSPKNGTECGGLLKKKVYSCDVENPMRGQHPEVACADLDGKSSLDKLTTHRTRSNDGRASQWGEVESQNGTYAHMSVAKYGAHVASFNASKDAQSNRPKSALKTSNGGRDNFNLESGTHSAWRDASSDEDTSVYSKYDKDDAEYKGPIKDHHQYVKYVQEYRDMYSHYCSLNKHLEKYRNQFSKFGHELELTKDRNMQSYCHILEQVKDLYRHSGMRHKKMKKIFVVIHEELRQIKQRIMEYAESYCGD